MTKDVKELDAEVKALTDELVDLMSDCSKCKMCVRFCPTYEGWYTQSSLGRLMALYYHLKYGLGNEEELSNLLFTCTTCRRCQQICKLMSAGAKTTDILVRGRNLLVKRAQARGEGK